MKIYVRIWFAILPAVEASIATVALTSAEDKVTESLRRSAILKYDYLIIRSKTNVNNVKQSL